MYSCVGNILGACFSFADYQNQLRCDVERTGKSDDAWQALSIWKQPIMQGIALLKCFDCNLLNLKFKWPLILGFSVWERTTLHLTCFRNSTMSRCRGRVGWGLIRCRLYTHLLWFKKYPFLNQITAYHPIASSVALIPLGMAAAL